MLTLVKFFSAKNFPPNGDIYVVCYLSILVHYAVLIQPLNIFYPNVTPCEIMYRKAGSTITSNYSYSIVPGKNLHSLVPEKWKEVWHLHQKVVVTGCTKKVLNFNCPRTSANLNPKFPHHHLAFSAKQGEPSSGEGCNVLGMAPTYSLITKRQQYLSLAVHETYECCG